MFTATEVSQEPNEPSYAGDVFDDYDARSNIVGLFNLLLRVDRRTRPELYHD